MLYFKKHLLTIALLSFVLFCGSCNLDEIKKSTDEDFGPTAAVLEGKIESASINKKLRDVSIDGNGNIYVTTKAKIYKLDASGNLNVFAGSDTEVVQDGTGTSAGFNNIDLITFDEENNLYVRDHGAIRKITPAGEVSSIKVTQPTVVPFNGQDLTGSVQIAFCAVYPIGNAFYTGDHYMMKITEDTYNIFIGGGGTQGLNDGAGAEASFLDLMGGFYDKSTNSIVTGDQSAVRRISLADSSVVTIAGTDQFGEVDGTMAEARFQFVRDIVSDPAGNLYVADRYAIRKISTTGQVSTIAGPNYKDGGQLHPGGLAIDNEGKFLYITDTEGAEPNPKGVLIKIDLSKI